MQIFYFSRSGNCKRIAEELAEKKGLVASRINDGRDWSGALNFLKAGAMSAKGEWLEINHEALEENAEIILVFPIWAGSFPPAIRTFLKEAKAHKITAVAASAKSKLKEKDRENFVAVYETFGKRPVTPEI